MELQSSPSDEEEARSAKGLATAQPPPTVHTKQKGKRIASIRGVSRGKGEDGQRTADEITLRIYTFPFSFLVSVGKTTGCLTEWAVEIWFASEEFSFVMWAGRRTGTVRTALAVAHCKWFWTGALLRWCEDVSIQVCYVSAISSLFERRRKMAHPFVHSNPQTSPKLHFGMTLAGY